MYKDIFAHLFHIYIFVVIAGVVTSEHDTYVSLIVEYLSRADMQPHIHSPGRSQASRGQEDHRVRARRLRHPTKQEAPSNHRSEERQGWISYNEHRAPDEHRPRRDSSNMQRV